MTAKKAPAKSTAKAQAKPNSKAPAESPPVDQASLDNAVANSGPILDEAALAAANPVADPNGVTSAEQSQRGLTSADHNAPQ